MNREWFANLFERALSEARTLAEGILGQSLPPLTSVKLVAFGQDGRWIGIEECLDFIYLDDLTFYPFIDVAVTAYSATHTGYFVRVSGHPPGSFASTWQPEGLGPFKIMGPAEPLKPLVR